MHLPSPLLCLLPLLSVAAADPPASYRNVIGKILVEERFEAAALPAAWTAPKGAWAVVDGALEGRERPEDQHAAVFLTKAELPATLVLKADVRFDGAATMALLFNGPQGHVCRVTLTPRGFTLSGDRDKKDEADKPAILAKVEQEFVQGTWYHVTIEIAGDEMLAWTDPTHVGYGRNAKIARTKSAMGIALSKVAGRIDNIQVWAAEADGAWEGRRAQLGIH